MRLCFILLLSILLPTTSKSQDLHITGQVLDAITQKPIVGTTIGVRSKKIFFRTTDEGKFDFMDQRLMATDTLTISYLGYQTQYRLMGKIKDPLIIRMETNITSLNQVTVSRIKMDVGSKALAHKLTGSFFPNTDAAMFMVGSNGKKGTIYSVGFYISDGHVSIKGDSKAPFRVKIFEASIDGLPGKELTKDVIVTSATANNEWLDIDMSQYGIKIPKRGFFVSFSLLNEEYYLLGKDYKQDKLITKSKDIITPRIGITATNEFKESYCFFKSHSGLWDGKWIKHPYHNNYMIRATINLGN